MKHLFRLTLALLLILPALAPRAADWPAWRGPDSAGCILTGNPPTSFTTAWQITLPGKGTSTPIVWQDRIYLTTPMEGQDAVMALDMNGKQLWVRKLGDESRPKHKTLASSGNASPVTDGKGIFVRFRSGTFAALEMDGSVRWKTNIVERFGPEVIVWDQASSPVVTDRHVIITRMHHGDSWIAAFDKATGQQAWLQKRYFEAPNENDNSYTTPVFFDYKGTPAFLVLGGDHLTAHAAADGKLLWSAGEFNPRGTGNWPAIALPVVVGDMAVTPIGRDDRQQGAIGGIRIDGSGDVTKTHRPWTRTDFGVFVCSPAIYQGRVYLLRDRGGVVCLDPATGKSDWEAAFPVPARITHYYSSPTIVNGILFAAREDGMVFAARVGKRFELLGQNMLGERIIASPVPVGDRLILRSDKHLFCVGPK